jgi:hypothetical protein
MAWGFYAIDATGLPPCRVYVQRRRRAAPLTTSDCVPKLTRGKKGKGT